MLVMLHSSRSPDKGWTCTLFETLLFALDFDSVSTLPKEPHRGHNKIRIVVFLWSTFHHRCTPALGMYTNLQKQGNHM